MLLLAIIPITLFVVKRQADLQTKAVASTNLSFTPTTATANVGQNFSVDIYADPGTNIVSIIELTISVDPDKLEIVSLTKNPDVLPVTLRPAAIDGGTVTMTVSTSNNVQEAIQEKTKVATLTLKPLSVTDGTTTPITIDQDASKVFSLSTADGATENVLEGVGQSAVTINPAGEGGTVTPTVPAGGGGTVTPTIPAGTTLTPTVPAGGGVTVTPTPGETAIGDTTGPTCSGLFIDRAASGTAPYTLVFTASGTKPSGTISKVNFTFGDGVVQEVTQAGGVGTANVNVQISHTYNNAGSFPASVTMTDSNGRISEVTTCTQTITVTEAVATTGGGGTTTTETGITDPTTTETIPATGTLETTLAIMGVIGVLVITGIFFLL